MRGQGCANKWNVEDLGQGHWEDQCYQDAGFFLLFRMSNSYPNPEDELLDLFTAVPGKGDTWPLCNKYLLNAWLVKLTDIPSHSHYWREEESASPKPHFEFRSSRKPCTHSHLVTPSWPTFLRLHGLACQVPLSMGFPRQEYWSWLPCPPPRIRSHAFQKAEEPTCISSLLYLPCAQLYSSLLHPDLQKIWSCWVPTQTLNMISPPTPPPNFIVAIISSSL